MDYRVKAMNAYLAWLPNPIKKTRMYSMTGGVFFVKRFPSYDFLLFYQTSILIPSDRDIPSITPGTI